MAQVKFYTDSYTPNKGPDHPSKIGEGAVVRAKHKNENQDRLYLYTSNGYTPVGTSLDNLNVNNTDTSTLGSVLQVGNDFGTFDVWTPSADGGGGWHFSIRHPLRGRSRCLPNRSFR